MNFVTYSNDVFSNLGNVAQLILQSTDHTINVNSLTICNRSVNDIRINLVKRIEGSDSSVREAFITENVEINSPTSNKLDRRSTVNLVSLFGLQIFLPVYTANNITYVTKLITYSNGITQRYDAVVDYTIFVEAPIT